MASLPMRKLLTNLILLLMLLGLAAWSPWITTEFARARAEGGFAEAWDGVIDGCGIHCNGCGAKAVEKDLFGAWVTLEYACGMLPADTPEYHQTHTGWVSFFGTLHGFPAP